MLKAVKVSPAQALQAASAAVPTGVPFRLAVQRRSDAIVHEVRLIVGDGEARVDIDAISGAVLAKEEVPLGAERRRELATMVPILRTAVTPLLQAVDAVLARVPEGRLLLVEAEIERDALEYEVTTLGAGGLAKAEVDSATGRIRTLVGPGARPVVDPRHHHFDFTAPGTSPAQWSFEAPGVDAPPPWVAMADPQAPSPPHVLGLAAPAGDPAAILVAWSQQLRRQDGRFEVLLRLRRTTAEAPGAGGLVWRLHDGLEHYALSLDGPANQLRLEAVKDGERRRIAAVPLPSIEPGHWYRLAIHHDGDRLLVSLDGKLMLEANDSTLPGEGAVGVWSRGDGKARFDELRVTEN